jgi:hypothetical protein
MVVWLHQLQEMIGNHVCHGFLKTYNQIYRLSRSTNQMPAAVQVVMEGIPQLARARMAADYQILLDTLEQAGDSEEELQDTIRRAYQAHIAEAFREAQCRIDRAAVMRALETAPFGVDFLHQVYTHAARILWVTPDILISSDGQRLMDCVHTAIARTVEQGVKVHRLLRLANIPEQSSVRTTGGPEQSPARKEPDLPLAPAFEHTLLGTHNNSDSSESGSVSPELPPAMMSLRQSGIPEFRSSERRSSPQATPELPPAMMSSRQFRSSERRSSVPKPEPEPDLNADYQISKRQPHIQVKLRARSSDTRSSARPRQSGIELRSAPMSEKEQSSNVFDSELLPPTPVSPEEHTLPPIEPDSITVHTAKLALKSELPPPMMSSRQSGIPEQSSARTAGVPEQSSARTAGVPEQSSARTAGVPEQSSARTAGVPEQSSASKSVPPAMMSSRSGGIPEQGSLIADLRSEDRNSGITVQPSFVLPQEIVLDVVPDYQVQLLKHEQMVQKKLDRLSRPV